MKEIITFSLCLYAVVQINITIVNKVYIFIKNTKRERKLKEEAMKKEFKELDRKISFYIKEINDFYGCNFFIKTDWCIQFSQIDHTDLSYCEDTINFLKGYYVSIKNPKTN